MFSDDASFSDTLICSDCKRGWYERRWTTVLLNWINNCVLPGSSYQEITLGVLLDTLKKYKNDICDEELYQILSSSEDLEPFLSRKDQVEAEDYPRKLYIMGSVILYRCCITSNTRVVDAVADICRNMDDREQELILKYCENLGEMKITASNVDVAIAGALDRTSEFLFSKLKTRSCEGIPSTNTMESSSESESSQEATSKAGLDLKTSIIPVVNVQSSVQVLMTSSVERSDITNNTIELSFVDGSKRQLTSVETSTITVYNLKETEVQQFSHSNDRVDAVEHADTAEPRSEHTSLCVRSDANIELRSEHTSLCMRSDANIELRSEHTSLCMRSDADTVRSEHTSLCVRSDADTVRSEDTSLCVRSDADVEPRSEHTSLCMRNDADGGIHPECSCLLTGASGADCGDTGKEKAATDPPKDAPRTIWRPWAKKKNTNENVGHMKCILLTAVPVVVVIMLASSLILFATRNKPKTISKEVEKLEKRIQRDDVVRTVLTPEMHWECSNNLCQKLYHRPKSGQLYSSLSRCTLLCTGPQLWPYPIGNTFFSNQIIAVAKNKLEYKFQTVPSIEVHQYLANAFNLFLKNLAKLEKSDLNVKNETHDLPLMKIYIQLDVESDPDPRLRLDTEESYQLQMDTLREQVKVTIASPSFCGVRHGLETLSQLILLDQSTGFLITLSKVMIRDGPSYKYRGLMIDTARNYIPVPDLMRTVDAMASCKLNTFHWRITDATSFPLLLPDFPQLFEYGGYDRSMVYTVDDIRALVDRAGVRGIRVLLEVAAPGPVGRAWSWTPDTSCPSTNENFTCENILCLRLKNTDTILDILENIYTFIIEVTKVDDIFHMSDGAFSYTRCYYLLDDREEFLDEALARLKIANKGFLPRLPIVWYTSHLSREYEMNTWKKFGVQLNMWQPDSESQSLSRFKVILSSKWDLSCEISKRRCIKYRTWQEMYAWKSWRNLEVLAIEGGEAILWTDLVDTSNLDMHLWPRAAAVAERLWSDVVANHTPGANEYLRLDAQRWRMLLRSVKVEPIWPVWCSFNPNQCLKKIL